jgi:hypothetical protein
MGLFSTVSAAVSCPRCGSAGRLDVQFSFGELWNYRYELGDRVILRDDQSWALHKRVIARGLASSCRNCAVDCLEFDVVIERGILTRIEAHRPERAFPIDDPYVVEDVG